MWISQYFQFDLPVFVPPVFTNVYFHSIKMLIPKKNRIAIYEYLFKEGVLVAKKDPFAAKHPEIEVPNLHVVKALTVSFILAQR